MSGCTVFVSMADPDANDCDHGSGDGVWDAGNRDDCRNDRWTDYCPGGNHTGDNYPGDNHAGRNHSRNVRNNNLGAGSDSSSHRPGTDEYGVDVFKLCFDGIL